MSNELKVLPPDNDLQTSPMQLLSLAIEKGTSIDQLERLMDLQERWEAKERRKLFFEALAKFQAKAPALKKAKIANVATRTGGSFQYKYADLGSITQEIKKPLSDAGLSYRWEFAENGDKMKVTCIISHVAGHVETTTMEGPRDTSGAKNDIQQVGSTHTYLQRYTLIGALGLSTAEQDTDGKMKAPPKPQQQKVQSQPGEEYIDTWKRELKQIKTRIALNSLYLKNKKVVDGDEAIQNLFKERESELKETEKNVSSKKPDLP